MTTGYALLKAILAAPEEDAPRLVYADWLQEQGGEERAEFIRVQIELARLGLGVKKFLCEPGETLEQGVGRMVADSKRIDPEYAAKLKARERELVNGFNGDRAACCPVAFPGIRLVGLDLGWYSGENVLGELRRGFVEQVTCTAADWLEHADALTWRPGQTVECPEVKWQVVRGVVDPDTHRRRKQDKYKDCGPCAPWCKGGCNGTGRVHRPCPPTAQPIREVTLTTWPELEVEHSGGNFWNRLVGRTWLPTATTPALLKAEWPGITFHLPPEPRRDQYAHWNPVTLATRNLATPIRFTDEMLRDMGTGYNAGDAVMEAWQREMGIPLPAADDEPPTV